MAHTSQFNKKIRRFPSKTKMRQVPNNMEPEESGSKGRIKKIRGPQPPVQRKVPKRVPPQQPFIRNPRFRDKDKLPEVKSKGRHNAYARLSKRFAAQKLSKKPPMAEKDA